MEKGKADIKIAIQKGLREMEKGKDLMNVN